MTTTDGLLLIDKPTGMTSHDVVARVRRALGERRVGHAGTLDPMATGLLVLAVGPSTRLLRFAQAGTKRYEGTVTFGVATDSLDADGRVVARAAVPNLDAATLEAAASAMRGEQTQVPPMVSAIKVKGRRLHALAREGVEVERAPRTIVVHDFHVAPSERPDVWTFSVTCSVGTYVRVLLSDLAARVGTIGHLSSLRRVASGTRRVEDALTLEEMERRAREGLLVLEPPRAFVEELASIAVDDEGAERLRRGQRVRAAGSDAPAATDVAALDARGDLVAIVTRRGDEWQPTLVLARGSGDERE